MRTAFISDIHGNYPALIKVIEDAKAQRADRFVFVGDYIFDMPYPNEVARFLMKMDNSCFIKGNKENYLNALKSTNIDELMCEQMGALYQSYKELSPDILNFLTCLENELTIPLESGGFIFVSHYLKGFKAQTKTNCESAVYHSRMLEKPFTHTQFLDKASEMLNWEEYKNAIDKIDASVIVYGHNHLQYYGYCGEKLIINPGSCGIPLDFDNRAAYTILEESESGFKVIERRVEYDIEKVISSTKASEMYEKGKIWCELTCLVLRTARDYYGFMFETADNIAKEKNESGPFYSNETWNEAYTAFKNTYCIK